MMKSHLLGNLQTHMILKFFLCERHHFISKSKSLKDTSKLSIFLTFPTKSTHFPKISVILSNLTKVLLQACFNFY